jgi:hypothetical protein
MTAVADAAPAMGTAPACRALGLPRASLYRGRRPPVVARPRPAPPRALASGARQAVLKALHSERFLDQAPAQVHATRPARSKNGATRASVQSPFRRWAVAMADLTGRTCAG